MKLTDAMLRNRPQAGKHFDGAGLFVLVTPAGQRYWRLKYRHAGKEKLLALGVYPEVGIKAARQLASDARQLLTAGIDPGAERKANKAQAVHDAVNTMRTVAGEWLDHQAARWTPRTRDSIRRSLELHIFPTLGARPLASITAKELTDTIRVIEAKGAGETAGRVLQRVKAIYRWATTHGRVQSNPMYDLRPSEELKPRDTKNRAALPERALPAFLAALDNYGGDPNTVNALRLLILVATRPGEVRGARWDEFDLAGALWVIPAERMKMRTEHRIPLSRQALAVLAAQQPLSGHGELVFPSPFYPGKAISDNTLNSALARMGYKGVATAAGFRSLFSTMANEAEWDADVIERQLAHLERNKVRAAYHRATYNAERARLMQWWADLLDQRRTGSNVIPLAQRSA
ncbi:integrase arm-type DNA-binding domain-containing protein [Ottowia sp.]|uniref:tyrosine-type recombinase/integrase n=1 Tax=Ottowia sp. TaxID=1898956 RepID=UPI002CFE22E7|nr:integrase arm-type DNA-binding domain-containing protein [Ottowia sp.]HRN76520.1 integrase arm-type DNA-binding domain-containing protein [Ottowia sp.]HRQ03712.1 integrase arm-type DNA-binding domain-containing protein [Ottowia sp.]